MSNEREDSGTNSHTLDGIQQALAQFTAASPQLDRDRLMFLAGQASGLASGGCEPPGGCLAGKAHSTGKLTLPARLLWPASTAALAATSLALLLALVASHQPQVVYLDRPDTAVDVEAVMAQRPAALEPATIQVNRWDAPPTPSLPRNNYLRVREVALRMGVDALGSQTYGSGAPSTATYGTMLEGMTPRQKDSSSLDSFLGM